jgi:signal transduction histidine kinase
MLALRPRRWLERVWWFDLAYPLTLALILFASLTAVLYSGMPSSRLALLAEGRLLELALLANRDGTTAKVDSDILVASALPTELDRFHSAPLGRRPEVSAADYARVIDRLATAGTKYIFVSWDLTAHPDSEVYYLPLIEVATRHQDQTTLLFAVAANRRMDFPKSLKPFVTVLDDVQCLDREDRQTICGYLPNFKNWVISVIIDLAVSQTQGHEEPLELSWVTSLLPSNVEAFALHLPAPNSLQTVSFSELLKAQVPQTARFAFVGADISGANSGTPDSRFVRTVFDTTALHIDAGGTALHVFWAQIASMFLQERFLRFPPEWVRIPLTLIVCAFIVFGMVSFGGSTAASILVIYAFTSFFLVAKVALALGWYVPLFDSLYFGLATLSFAGSARLSYLSFLKWRLQESEKLHTQTADLKSNFISLVSHNLNTPVAKMQGMIGIVQSLAKDPAILERLREAQRLVTRLEFTIRFVLNTVALDEGKLNEAPRSIASLLGDFTATNQSALRKLGVAPTLTAAADPPELLQIPLRLDSKITTTVLAAMLALCSSDDAQDVFPIKMHVDVASDSADESIQIRITITGGNEPLLARALGPDPTLFKDVAADLVKRFTERYRGRFVSTLDVDGLPRLVGTLQLP